MMKKTNESNKPIISASIIIITVILLLMNVYGLRSANFDITKGDRLPEENLYAYTPHLSYPRGTYDINVSGTGKVVLRTADGNVLCEGDAGQDIELKLKKDESDIIVCAPQSTNLTNIKVSKNGMLYTDVLFLTLFLSLGLIFIAYARFSEKINRENAAIAGIIACAVIMASYPLFSGGVLFGHDLNFHLYRIEGIKDGLLSGQFPVRVHPTHNNGYGYITSSVYPELFLYFPAVLRLLGMSPVMAYNTFLVGVNAMTAFVMYYSAKGMSKSKYVGLIASVIYTLSTWRVINLYYRAAVGEALAMVFFPLVIYGLYCILKGDKKKWWVFALACTGIFQSHIISTVFVALTTLAAIIMFWKSFASQRRYMGMIKAGVLTVLLNAWYLAAFVRYYMGLDMAIKHVPENTEYFQNAIFPTQLFNIFNTNFGYSQLLNMGIRSDMSLTLGVGVTICAVLCLVYFVFRRKREMENEGFVFGMFALGVLIVFMATTIFPWQLLQQNPVINKFCGTVRMPWRFLSLASPIFTIAAAMIIGVRSRNDTTKRVIIAVTCFVCAISFVSWGTAYTTQNDIVLRKGYAVGTGGSVGLDNEYYLTGTNPTSLTANKYSTSGGVSVLSHEKSGTNIKLELSGATDNSWVEVPLLYYPGYSAKDDNGNKLLIKKGNNNVLRVKLENGANSIKIRYGGFWYFKIADIISLLTVIACAALAYGKRKGRIEGWYEYVKGKMGRA